MPTFTFTFTFVSADRISSASVIVSNHEIESRRGLLEALVEIKSEDDTYVEDSNEVITIHLDEIGFDSANPHDFVKAVLLSYETSIEEQLESVFLNYSIIPRSDDFVPWSTSIKEMILFLNAKPLAEFIQYANEAKDFSSESLDSFYAIESRSLRMWVGRFWFHQLQEDPRKLPLFQSERLTEGLLLGALIHRMATFAPMKTDTFIQTWYDAAIQNDEIDALNFLVKFDSPSIATFYYAVQYDRLECLQWLINQRRRMSDFSEVSFSLYHLRYIFTNSLKFNAIRCLNFLLQAREKEIVSFAIPEDSFCTAFIHSNDQVLHFLWSNHLITKPELIFENSEKLQRISPFEWAIIKLKIDSLQFLVEFFESTERRYRPYGSTRRVEYSDQRSTEGRERRPFGST